MLDVNATAQMLGVTTRFVRRLVDERRIPFHKIGKFVRISCRRSSNPSRGGWCVQVIQRRAFT